MVYIFLKNGIQKGEKMRNVKELKDQILHIRVTKAEKEFLKAALQSYRIDNSEYVPVKRIVAKQKEVEIDKTKPVSKAGIDVNDFLRSRGLDPLPVAVTNPEPEKTTEEKQEDFEEWKQDRVMMEIDRGCVYEIDGFGYPDEAEKFAKMYPSLWSKMFRAKQAKQFAVYNEMMQREVWPLVQNGGF